MTRDLLFVACSAVLTWVMLMTASFLRFRWWTPKGMALACSNRQDVPDPRAVAARADRAAKNMLENFVLFAALVLVARVGGVPGARLELGAGLFFWARVAYFAVYLAGVPYLRTAIWSVSVAGMGMIAAAMV
jgi:uncharacterized MAPEG superfamily protein